jgi:hypothetical protein
MKKTVLLPILFVVVQLAVAVIAEAQQPKKIYRLGFLSNRAEIGPNEEAFRRGLSELGSLRERILSLNGDL